MISVSQFQSESLRLLLQKKVFVPVWTCVCATCLFASSSLNELSPPGKTLSSSSWSCSIIVLFGFFLRLRAVASCCVRRRPEDIWTVTAAAMCRPDVLAPRRVIDLNIDVKQPELLFTSRHKENVCDAASPLILGVKRSLAYTAWTSG